MKISTTKLNAKYKAKLSNANKRGIKFSLDHNDLRVLFERNSGHCDYTGVPFTDKRVPTIERINDKLGYEPGNLCLTCEQANQMKDSLLDKTHVKAFRVRKDSLEILDALRTKLTPEYLDHLRQKYRADMNYNPTTDLYKNHFSDLQESVVSVILEQEIEDTNIEEKAMSKVEAVAAPTQKKTTYKLPDDVRVARYYATLAEIVAKDGMEFSINYAEFKARLGRKTCSFSSKVLDNASKFVLVLDKEKPVTRENMAVVDEQFGHKISALSVEMGLSVTELAKMFKRLA